jgi:hypothetical protein
MEPLKQQGHDVDWCGLWDKDPGDEQILAHAFQEKRIRFTMDKDFGELVILKGLSHSGLVRLQGFAIYLDGVNLPDEVYQQSDSNVVVAEIDKRLEGHGKIESHWQGPTETALYIYGDSIDVMKPLIKDFMDEYPLCKGARVVDLTPK